VHSKLEHLVDKVDVFPVLQPTGNLHHAALSPSHSWQAQYLLDNLTITTAQVMPLRNHPEVKQETFYNESHIRRVIHLVCGLPILLPPPPLLLLLLLLIIIIIPLPLSLIIIIIIIIII
jgi:hypothetical protein